MTLSFLDLLILRVLYENRAHPPSQRQLLVPGSNDGLVNAYLQEHHVPDSFTVQLTSNQRLMAAIQRLRACHLIEPVGTYVPTAEVEALWSHIGAAWALWPHKLPFDDEGKLLYEQAEHRRTVRNYRKRKATNE